MTKENLTQITIVLDRSGSMASVREATIGGFNEFVEGQKAVPGDANLTLIQFDTENAYEVVFRPRAARCAAVDCGNLQPARRDSATRCTWQDHLGTGREAVQDLRE